MGPQTFLPTAGADLLKIIRDYGTTSKAAKVCSTRARKGPDLESLLPTGEWTRIRDAFSALLGTPELLVEVGILRFSLRSARAFGFEPSTTRRMATFPKVDSSNFRLTWTVLRRTPLTFSGFWGRTVGSSCANT